MSNVGFLISRARRKVRGRRYGNGKAGIAAAGGGRRAQRLALARPRGPVGDAGVLALARGAFGFTAFVVSHASHHATEPRIIYIVVVLL